MRLDFEKKEKRNSKRRSIFRGAIIILSVLVLHSAFFLWKNRSNAGSDKFDEKTSSEGKRVIAVITVGWEPHRYLRESRGYLELILQRYTNFCELGHSVSVDICLYESEGAQHFWSSKIQEMGHYCERIKSNITVSLEFFHHRKLPNGAYGTKGDLAIRYREIFLRELDRYDTFIVQEDDVIFSENIITYFYTWLYFLQNYTNGKLLPSLYDAEISDINQEKYASPRLTNGTFFKIGDETFFRSGHSIGGRSLILTRDLLEKSVGKRPDEWINPNRVRGEFNPTVSTFHWMENVQGTSPKRLVNRLVNPKNIFVFPVSNSSWKQAEVHHLSNKYINHEVKVENGWTTWIKISDISAIFDSCLEDGKENFLLTDDAHKILFTGISCFKCLESGKNARLRTIVHRRRNDRKVSNESMELLIEANFKCEMFSFARHFI
jgi:hypothetical protein